MNTILELRAILDRLEKCPLNVFRVELDMFCNALERDTNLITVIRHIIGRSEAALGSGPKAATLVTNVASSSWGDLSFANSAPLRAAVGYQVCQTLLSELNPIKCGKNVVQLGSYYWTYQGMRGQPDAAAAVRVFSEVFLHPLVAYLAGALETGDQILMLLSRYKQRSEWFLDEALIKSAMTGEKGLERTLRRDLLRYLFDNGIVFSVESETPPGGGEVDILPVLPDLGPLTVEVKVFDGNGRNQSYISGGMAQAADYARKFNNGQAYYFVYNVAENTVLTLPGALAEGNVVRASVGGVDVYSIVANLQVNLPSSRAKSLKSVRVPLPAE